METLYITINIIILLLTVSASIIAIIKIRSWFSFFLVFGALAKIFFMLINTRWLFFYEYSFLPYDLLSILSWLFNLLFAMGLVGLALNVRKKGEKYTQQEFNTSMPYNQSGMIPAPFVKSWPHSLAFYFASILICNIISMPLSFISIIANLNDEPEIGAVFILIALPISIFAGVVFFMFIYHAWKSIQPYGVRTTPGKAVGFLFIPFFNIYWIFQVFYGLAKDFNRIAKERSLNLRISEGLALTYCIIGLFCAIPLLGILLGLAAFILLLIFICQTYNAIDGLSKANMVTSPSSEPSTQTPIYPENSF